LHISNIAFVIVVNDQFNILFVFTPEEEDRWTCVYRNSLSMMARTDA
jgi:hypothetical protein